MKMNTLIPFFKDGQYVPRRTTDPIVVTANESQVFNNQIYSDLTIEVKGTAGTGFPVKLKGCIDTESAASWTEITGVNLHDMSMAAEITEPGLYSYSVSGVSHLKITCAAANDLTITGHFVE